jgi:hypothetical protein
VISHTGTPVNSVSFWTGPAAINSAKAALRALVLVSVKGEGLFAPSAY